jgi:hypothetical protein
MVKRPLASRVHRKARRAKAQSAEHVYGVPVPEGLHDAIETERGNLCKAESVLGCLAIAMEYETDSANGPHYPDVAELARELVRQSINGLDSLVLQQRLLRNKIKESSDPSFAEVGYAVLGSLGTGLGVYRGAAGRPGTLGLESMQRLSLVAQQEEPIPVDGLNPSPHH